MPLYEYKCEVCNKEFETYATIEERLNVKCKCGGVAKQQLSPPHQDWFKPFVSEDFTGEPILVRTKNHLKQNYLLE